MKGYLHCILKGLDDTEVINSTSCHFQVRFLLGLLYQFFFFFFTLIGNYYCTFSYKLNKTEKNRLSITCRNIATYAIFKQTDEKTIQKQKH